MDHMPLPWTISGDTSANIATVIQREPRIFQNQTWIPSNRRNDGWLESCTLTTRRFRQLNMPCFQGYAFFASGQRLNGFMVCFRPLQTLKSRAHLKGCRYKISTSF